MRKLLVACTLLGASASAIWVSPAAAQDAGQIARASSAETRGALLWAYDQAAWHATDQARADLTGKIASELSGYIVEPAEGGGYDVTFYGGQRGGWYGIARYRWVTGTSVAGGLLGDRSTQLSERAKQMISARDLVLRSAMSISGLFLCSQTSPNTVVLPPDDRGTMAVYLLSSTTDTTSYPLGGHSRIEVTADGRIGASRPFMKGCLPLSWMGEKGQTPAAVVATHILDEEPNEIDFFVSRNIPVALVIGAGGYVWPISNGTLQKPQPLRQ